ncbi:MAG: flavodoxin family protein [Anaerolineales bacterium]|jgi:flavodoxin
MKTLVIYDSKYGHTRMIAEAIGEAINGQIMLVSEPNPADLAGFDLVIIGSPTHGGWYTEGIQDLLKAESAFNNLNLAVFDTRTKRSLFGFAAPRMARNLEKSGANLLATPEGFVVLGVKGPLKNGELERAAAWAREIANRYKEHKNE